MMPSLVKKLEKSLTYLDLPSIVADKKFEILSLIRKNKKIE